MNYITGFVVFIALLFLQLAIAGISRESVILVTIIGIGSFLFSFAKFSTVVMRINTCIVDGKIKKFSIWEIIDAYISMVLGATSVTFAIWINGPSSAWTGISNDSIATVFMRIVYTTVLSFNSGDNQFVAQSNAALFWVICLNMLGTISQIVLVGLGVNVVFKAMWRSSSVQPVLIRNALREMKKGEWEDVDVDAFTVDELS